MSTTPKVPLSPGPSDKAVLEPTFLSRSSNPRPAHPRTASMGASGRRRRPRTYLLEAPRWQDGRSSGDLPDLSALHEREADGGEKKTTTRSRSGESDFKARRRSRRRLRRAGLLVFLLILLLIGAVLAYFAFVSPLPARAPERAQAPESVAPARPAPAPPAPARNLAEPPSGTDKGWSAAMAQDSSPSLAAPE